MKKITVTVQEEIDVKRFYIPVKLQGKCEKCATDIEVDLSITYLSYPVINTPDAVYYYCESCGNEGEVPLTVGITLEIPDNFNVL